MQRATHEGRRGVDRHGTSLGGWIDLLASMELKGVKVGCHRGEGKKG